MATDESSTNLNSALPSRTDGTEESPVRRPPPLRKNRQAAAAPPPPKEKPVLDSTHAAVPAPAMAKAAPAKAKRPSPRPKPVEKESSPPAESDKQPASKETPEKAARPKRRNRNNSTSAFLGSMITHVILLLVLGLWVMPDLLDATQKTSIVEIDRVEDELDTVVLDQQVEAATEVTPLGTNSANAASGSRAGEVAELSLNKAVASTTTVGQKMHIDGPVTDAPAKEHLLSAVPDGQLGDPRAIVDNYDQAMDRITQELLWMLSKSNVLVVWCFDQSESMKDDQKEIRQRIDRVYDELGLKVDSANDALTTAITSYGNSYMRHTRRPTSDIGDIREAIDEVPVDPSGKEMMCAAVGQSILDHSGYVGKGKRQMALVLVTDESGDPKNNIAALESAIAQAKATGCRIYILGREAVFGYPYAHMRWVHPYTKHVHWLPIDRGPESGVLEQLQTEGFRKRTDAHPSGFGPYEQSRMARQTGGIFFLLPSLETDLVRGEKRRYELEAMRGYRPDLRARGQQIQDLENSRLRATLAKVIHDLNPYRPEVAKNMQVALRFSVDPQKFLTLARAEQLKAKSYILYLDAAAKELEKIRRFREQEASPRWQGNYDLIYAQILAYTARTYEYGAYLEGFIKKPKLVPFTKPKQLKLTHWDIGQSQKTVGGNLTDSYIQRSKAMFNDVIREHPGTPWAARAEWELKRGFGVQLHERYSYTGPRKPPPPRPTRPKITIPKL